MTIRPGVFRAALATLLLTTPIAIAPATARTAEASAAARQRSVVANGIHFHYAETGDGDPVLLLPGWPEDGYAWRRMVPLFVARGRRVIVLDPRGFGDSDKPATGYDLDMAAADVHAFLAATGLLRPGGIDIVSHDLGGWIGYALATNHPGDVRRLVLSEVTLPNATAAKPIPDDAANIKTWHFGFNRLPSLPETLVEGHERAFLTWLFDNKATRPGAIDAAARDEYVRVFSSPGAAHAGFEYYRALFGGEGLKRMGERMARPLPMPVLAVGGDGGVGRLLIESLQGAATNVRGEVIPSCGHYLPEECPAEFMTSIDRFWRETPATRR